MNPNSQNPDWNEIELLAAACKAALNDALSRGVTQRGQNEFTAALDNQAISDPLLSTARKLRKAGGHAAMILAADPREPSSRRGIHGALCEALLAYEATMGNAAVPATLSS